MSFDDHLTARPTAQQTARSSPEQLRRARAVCESWVISRENGDPDALRDLLDMLDLWPTAGEREGEAEAS